ncbi:MAG: helix-turn-helix transcriptional regulator [Clostridia bacterium]|nr:helix-turn-helix transcriptional regulator [Clostridia bacterium]
MKKYTLKQLRESRGMTQNQVANATNKSIRYISMLEQGLRNPSDQLKEDLAKLYKVSVMQIFLAIKTTKSCLKEVEK